MNTQPEALRLADALEDDLHADDGTTLGLYSQGIADNAAAELRRLHEELQEQCRINGMGAEREARLMAVNQELVKVLKLAREALHKGKVACEWGQAHDHVQQIVQAMDAIRARGQS